MVEGIKKIIYYRNEAGTVELEFLIQNENGSIPTEVKTGKSRSLV